MGAIIDFSSYYTEDNERGRYEKEILCHARDVEFLQRLAINVRRRLGYDRQILPPIDELVNEAFVAILEHVHCYDPARGSAKRFVIGVATAVMKRYAGASIRRLTLHEYKDVRSLEYYKAKGRQPHESISAIIKIQSLGELTKNVTARREKLEDDEEPSFVAKVRQLLNRAPAKDRELLLLYLQENGNVATMARQLGCKKNTLWARLQRLFKRAREPYFFAASNQRSPLAVALLTGKVVVDESRLSPEDRELLQVLAQESGKIQAVADRLGRDSCAISYRLKKIISNCSI